MTTTEQEKQHAVQEQQKRRERNAVIGNGVLHALGQPRDLHRVQVRRLWADYYRVNVLVGVDAVSARIAHSYFLAADCEGNISACSPEIMRQY